MTPRLTLAPLLVVVCVLAFEGTRGEVAAQASPDAAPALASEESRPPATDATKPKASLADAPEPGEASGIAVPRSQDDHKVANAFLLIPRSIAVFLLTGPRLAAAEVDDYLEGKSANVRNIGSGSKPSWRYGAAADWETTLGPSLGLRVGYQFGERLIIDSFGGFFGARGQSGGLRGEFGQFSKLKIRPTLTASAGRDLARKFSGVGEDAGVAGDPYSRGPEAGYDAAELALKGRASARVGPLRVIGRAAFERVSLSDDGDTPVSELYDEAALRGFGESQLAGSASVAVVFDTRQPAHQWIPHAAPSSGVFVRGEAGYLQGDASTSGSFKSGLFSLEARGLLDLFRGDRVLSVGAHIETITADAGDIPFNQLPTLGGRHRLRALVRGDLRDQTSTYADLQYEWAIGRTSRAYIFGENGAVHGGLGDIDLSRRHLGFGGGLRMLSGDTTTVRLQLAGSEDGDIGFFVQLGDL